MIQTIFVPMRIVMIPCINNTPALLKLNGNSITEVTELSDITKYGNVIPFDLHIVSNETKEPTNNWYVFNWSSLIYRPILLNTYLSSNIVIASTNNLEVKNYDSQTGENTYIYTIPKIPNELVKTYINHYNNYRKLITVNISVDREDYINNIITPYVTKDNYIVFKL